MTDPKPFDGSPFTDVDLEGGLGYIVALPREQIRNCLDRLAYEGELVGGDHRIIVDVPVLLHEEDGDVWTIETATIRLELLAAMVPWTPKPADQIDAALALVDARRADPEAFTTLLRLVEAVEEQRG